MDNNQKTFENMKKSYQNRTMSKEGYLHLLVKMKEAERRNQIELRKKCAKIAFPIAASIAAVLFVLPNTSKDIAYAMSQVPVLNQIVEVATIRQYDFDDGEAEAAVKVPELSISTSTDDNGEEAGEEAATFAPIDQQDVAEELKSSFADVNSQIAKIADKLVAEFKAGIRNKEGFQNVIVNYRVIEATDDYFTLKLICHQVGASAAEWDYYYTINLKNGRLVTWDSMFADVDDYKEVIKDELRKQMKDIMEQDSSKVFWVLDDDCLDGDVELLTEDTQFYINGDGELVICYGEGDVAPMCMGTIDFVISTEVIKPILK